MATVQQWAAPEAIQTALTTELNALANAGITAVSGVIDNSTGTIYQYINLEAALASLTPTGSPVVVVYAVYSSDGTNYDDTSALSAEVIATIPISTGVGAKRNSRIGIIRPLKFKLFEGNYTNVALGATGNTLKYARFNETAI